MKRVLAILGVGILAAAAPATAEPSKTEKWRCFAPSDIFLDNALVELTAMIRDGEVQGAGRVSIALVTYPARFQVAGLERRWGFGGEERNDYAFVITLDGNGTYYDFSNVKDGTRPPPSLRLQCVSP